MPQTGISVLYGIVRAFSGSLIYQDKYKREGIIMKKFTALFMMVVMLLALIGCGNNDMEKFVGVWSGETIGGVETNPYSEYLSGLTDLLS